MSSRVLYRGPSLADLHERYAKRGQIDELAPIRATCAVEIEASPAAVWGRLADPDSWHELDPAIGHVRLEGRLAPDTGFTWRNGSARIRSRFAVVEHERELTWTGRSMGAQVVHRHLLEPSAGGTRLTCHESMAGPFLTLLYSERKLGAALEQWLGAIKAAAERV